MPTPLDSLRSRALIWAVAVVLAAAAGWSLSEDWQRAGRTPVVRAADALPVYLAAAAISDGADPTSQFGLKEAYDVRGMKVRAATYSNLYPASAGVLAQPLASRDWSSFVVRWRALLMLGALLAGAGAGLASASGRAAPVAAALGAWLAVGPFPVTAECTALGQANLLVAGLFGLTMAALARGHDGLAGVAAVFGGALKLVPLIALWPMMAARRWRALAAALVVGVGLAGLTVALVPMDRVLAGIVGTLQFQAAITPDWMNHGPTPRWMWILGVTRHTPVAVWTVVLAGIAAFVAPREPQVLAGTLALTAAWLGADAAAFHILYAPLYLPALVWVATWPLDRDAPRFAWLAPLVAAVPVLLYRWRLVDVVIEARLVLAGLVVWSATAARLLWSLLVSARAKVPMAAWFAIGILVGWEGAQAASGRGGPMGPPLIPGKLLAVRLPRGVGHGGPVPGEDDRPDTSPRAPAPSAPDRPDTSPRAPAPSDHDHPSPLWTQPEFSGTLLTQPLSALLPPKACERLTSHLLQAPSKWKAVDDPRAWVLARSAPKPPAAMVTYGDMMRYLEREQELVDTLTAQVDPPRGLASAADELRRTWAVLDRVRGGKQ